MNQVITKKETKSRAPRVKKEASANILEAIVWSQEGKKTGTVMLPERVFGARWNPDLVHQVVTVMQANARIPYAHTKDRGEVRGGGRKPWQQKGTGRARHSSIRSPIWRGGGITFGPRKEKIFARSLNKNMKVQALYSVLSRKLKDGEILFLDALTFAGPKTAEAKKVMHSLGGVKGFERISTKKRNTLLVALNARNSAVEKSFRNFGNVSIEEVRNLNPVEALKYKYVAIVEPKEALQKIAARSRKQKFLIPNS